MAYVESEEVTCGRRSWWLIKYPYETGLTSRRYSALREAPNSKTRQDTVLNGILSFRLLPPPCCRVR